jgi:hypothetical protein
MAILLLADHDNASLSDQTAKTLTAAAKIGGDVHVLVAGKGAKAAADAAAKLSGVSKVLLAPSDDLANNLAEPLAALIVSLAGSYDTIISAATSVGKNVLPRVAALLDVAQVSEIIEVVSADTFKRPIYAGNAIQTVQSTDAKKVITVRTASFAAASEGGSASVETITASANPGLSTFVDDALSENGPSGTDIGQDHHLRWPRARLVRKVPGSHPAGRRQARRRRRRLARRRRCRLRAERLAGRPDRQGRRARSLHRRGHLGRHPAPRRHEGFEGHRRHQQGRGSADLPGRRLRPRRRSLRYPAGAAEGACDFNDARFRQRDRGRRVAPPMFRTKAGATGKLSF